MNTPRFPQRITTRRGILTGLAALTASGALAACSSEQDREVPAVPSGPTLEAPTPAADAAQISEVIGQIDQTLTTADEARDAELLPPRVSGSAQEFRSKTYAIIGKVPEWSTALTGPSAEMLVAMTTTQEAWPRTALALVQSRTEDSVPYFVALQQSDARAPYTTWGWAQQAAGVEMPMVPDASVGSEVVAADADGLALTPAAALALYATVLGLGTGEDKEGKLNPDPFLTETHAQIAQEREQLNAGVQQDEAATVGERYTVREGDYLGVRTDDGGAIVMGTLDSQRTVSIKAGANISYTEDNVYTKLAGTRTFSSEYVRTYGTTVALYVPPAEGGGKIQPIGATRVLLESRGS